MSEAREDTVSKAEFDERIEKITAGAAKALQEAKVEMDAKGARRWANSSDRARFEGGEYDGVGLEYLEAMSFAHADRGQDFKSIADGLKTLTDKPRDRAEAHFDALKQKLAAQFGPRHNPVLQRMEDEALGRQSAPWQREGRVNLFGGPFIRQADEITSNPQAAATIQPILDSTLWTDMMLTEFAMLPRIPQYPMPTQQTLVPNFDDVIEDFLNRTNAQTVQQSEVDAQDNTPTTLRQTQLNAVTLQRAMAISQQAREDSVINLAMEIRDRMVIGGSRGLDNFMINSDPTAAATAADGSSGNINASAAAGSVTRIPFPNPPGGGTTGMRAWCIADADRQVDAGGNAIDTDDLRGARKILRFAAVDPMNFFYVCGTHAYYAAQVTEEFRTYDNAAMTASILTGAWRPPGGSPVVLTPAIAEEVTASGRESGTAANNTLGQMLVVNASMWRLGVRIPFRMYSADGVLDHQINPLGLNFLLRGRFAFTVRNQTETRYTAPAALIRNFTV